jgi:hypothetical protein
MDFHQLQDRESARSRLVYSRKYTGSFVVYNKGNGASEFNEGNFLAQCVTLDESATPWWLKLGGAGFTSNGLRWRIWQVSYFAGVWGMGIWTLIYVLSIKNPTVFAVFVVIRPEPSKLLRIVQKIITTVYCFSHLWIHIWLVMTRWQMPRLSPAKNHLKYNWAVAIYLTILVVTLISGNLINPGKWCDIVNIVVWGLCGAIYVWYPFMVPFAMFIAECQTHKIRLDSFQEALTQRAEESTEPLSSEEVKDITEYYFSIARSISTVNNTFQLVLPLQLMTLVLAITTNISQTVVANEQGESFKTDFMTISIVSVMLFQIAVPMLYAASCNHAGDRVLRAIAVNSGLVVLLQQTNQWTPYIRLCGVYNGIQVTYRSLFYTIPLLIYYVYAITKLLGPIML